MSPGSEYSALAVGPFEAVPRPPEPPAVAAAHQRAQWVWLLLVIVLLHGLSNARGRHTQAWVVPPAPASAAAAAAPWPVSAQRLPDRPVPGRAQPYPVRLAAQLDSDDVLTPEDTPDQHSEAGVGRLPVKDWTAGLPQWAGRTALLGLSLPGVGSALDLEGPLSILTALAVVTVIIVIHEFGHFIAARLLNIHIAEFSIGLGPRLWRYQGPRVTYVLRAFPTGGFVAFPDDDPKSAIPKDDPNLLRNRPVRDRVVVVSAGVLANLLAAFLILLTQVQTMGVERVVLLNGVAISEVVPESPAALAGIQANDIIVGVQGQPIGKSSPDRMRSLLSTIRNNPGQPLDLVVERDNRVFPVTVLTGTRGNGNTGVIGATLKVHYALELEKPQGFPAAVAATGAQLVTLVQNVVAGFQALLGSDSNAQLSGPVKIITMGAEVTRDTGFSGLYRFAAGLNVNLAVLNVLPLPGLDGGMFVLLVLEAIRGSKLPGNAEKLIQGSGFLFFAGCGAVILFKDFADLLIPRL
eukprot:EG_transcript_5882